MECERLIRPLVESIFFSDEIKDMAVDYAELALDDLSSMINNGVSSAFLEIPIVKSAVALGKIGWSIGSAFRLKKQLAFIMSLQQGKPNAKAIEKRRRAILNHEKWVEREIEISAVYLERYANVKKAVYQARIYIDLVNEVICYKEYEEYLTILDRLFISDIEQFLDIVTIISKNCESIDPNMNNQIKEQFDLVRCRRLESLGLLFGSVTTMLGTSNVDKYDITRQGGYFYTILCEENDKNHIIIRKPNNGFIN